MAIRVLLVEDHNLVRRGIAMLVNTQDDMEVISEASCGEDCLEMARSLSPDVVILDLALPDIPGLVVLEQLQSLPEPPNVLVLTMYEDLGYLEEALHKGAKGYLIKRAVEDELIKAIREVAKGEIYVHPLISGRFLNYRLEAEKKDLGPREREILILWAKGYSNDQIAGKVFISRKTVEFYKTRIKKKLGFRSKSEIVNYCLENGLLSPQRVTNIE